MSWLEEQKTEAKKAKVEAEKAKKAHDDLVAHRYQLACNRAACARQTKFGDLEGRPCFQEIDGKRENLGNFHSEVKNNFVIFFAGTTKLGEIMYGHQNSRMWFYLPYTKNNGTKLPSLSYSSENNIQLSYQGYGYDNLLGEYLLNFLE